MGAKKIEIEKVMFAAKIDRFFKSHNRPNTMPLAADDVTVACASAARWSQCRWQHWLQKFRSGQQSYEKAAAFSEWIPYTLGTAAAMHGA